MKQTTLKNAFTVTGKGLHTGQMSTATFKPADVNTGYVFKRMDSRLSRLWQNMLSKPLAAP